MIKGSTTTDMETGVSYKSQYDMIKHLFPHQTGMNHFFMYHVYKTFPGRFMVNGVIQYGGYKMHWDISTSYQVMVNCGLDWADLKTRDLAKVTCKKCLKTVDMAPKRLVEKERSGRL